MYRTPLLRLVRGAFSISLLMSMSEVFSVTLIKLCYTKALAWSSLVPVPKAKSSSSEIMNPTPFTISYHLGSCPASSGEDKNIKGSTFSAFPVYTFSASSVNEWHALCEALIELCSAVSQGLIMTEGSPKKRSLIRVLSNLPMPRYPTSLQGSSQKWAKHVDRTFLSWSAFPGLFDHFVVVWGIRTTNIICRIIDLWSILLLCTST